MGSERSQTVDKALQLLEYFSQYEELGITELASFMNTDKTTVFRLVTSLANAGFLQKNEQTKKYRLGLKLLHYGTLVNERNELANFARPYMSSISAKYQVSSLLSTLEGNLVRVLWKVSAGPIIYMSAQVGLLMPAYCMASGKALLAYSGEENIRSYVSSTELTPYTVNTITDPAALKQELEIIRTLGYAKDHAEATIGLSCLSVPVFGAKGRPAAAISASGQTEIINSKEPFILQDLRAAAGAIGKMLS